MRRARAFVAILVATALVLGACGRRDETSTQTTTTLPPPIADSLGGTGSPSSTPNPDTTTDTSASTPLRGASPADLVRVTSPSSGALVTSPLVVTGEARGPWYFEASFPVRLVDDSGHDLAIGPAQAEGEWMTERFVPFKATLTFKAPRGRKGVLILERANPSGETRHAGEFRVPVRFQ